MDVWIYKLACRHADVRIAERVARASGGEERARAWAEGASVIWPLYFIAWQARIVRVCLAYRGSRGAVAVFFFSGKRMTGEHRYIYMCVCVCACKASAYSPSVISLAK